MKRKFYSKKAKTVFALFFCFVGFAVSRPSIAVGWGGSLQNDVGETGGIGGMVLDLRRNLGQVFRPVLEIVSPVPLRLGVGVRPCPEAVFGDRDGGDIEGGDVLGVSFEDDMADRAGSVFVREGRGGVRVYSLTGDFDDAGGETDVSGKPGKSMTEPKDRGEVWGARIAFIEAEVTSWSKDSGVILGLLAAAGFVLLAAGVVVIGLI